MTKLLNSTMTWLMHDVRRLALAVVSIVILVTLIATLVGGEQKKVREVSPEVREKTSVATAQLNSQIDRYATIAMEFTHTWGSDALSPSERQERLSVLSTAELASALQNYEPLGVEPVRVSEVVHVSAESAQMMIEVNDNSRVFIEMKTESDAVKVTNVSPESDVREVEDI